MEFLGIDKKILDKTPIWSIMNKIRTKGKEMDLKEYVEKNPEEFKEHEDVTLEEFLKSLKDLELDNRVN